MEQVYALRPPVSPWGDYGRILQHGLSRHLPRSDGRIQLERSGPWIPPISFPGVSDVLVTDMLMRSMLQAGIRVSGFLEVHKARVVFVDWISWDRTSEVPRVLPLGGEPENYILDSPHDERLAAEIGSIWEVLAVTVGRGTKSGVAPRSKNVAFSVAFDGHVPNVDLFRTSGLKTMFCTQRIYDFVHESGLEDFVKFVPVVVSSC